MTVDKSGVTRYLNSKQRRIRRGTQGGYYVVVRKGDTVRRYYRPKAAYRKAIHSGAAVVKLNPLYRMMVPTKIRRKVRSNKGGTHKKRLI